MADLQAITRELETARTRDDNHARVRLIPRALERPDAQPHRAAYLDELAYAYQQLGCFDEAVDAMRQAVAAGWDGEFDDHPTAQSLIADLLLRAGRTQEADDAWLGAERDHPRNPWLHQAAGVAYADVGLYSKALPRQTKGLKLALGAGKDGDMIWLLTTERAENSTRSAMRPTTCNSTPKNSSNAKSKKNNSVLRRSTETEAPRRFPHNAHRSGSPGSRPTNINGPSKPGRASPRTTSTDPTRRTARDSNYSCATSRRRASRGWRSPHHDRQLPLLVR